MFIDKPKKNANSKERCFYMSLIEFIHNLVSFCVGHVASLQLAAVVDGLQNNTLKVAITDRKLKKETNITAKSI